MIPSVVGPNSDMETAGAGCHSVGSHQRTLVAGMTSRPIAKVPRIKPLESRSMCAQRFDSGAPILEAHWKGNTSLKLIGLYLL
jgi:hypothetical protein